MAGPAPNKARVAFDLPKEVRDWLRDRAESSYRTITAEATLIFEEAMKKEVKIDQREAA